ncbi:MAG: ATP-binding protein, partial [Myxococcota bacterium]
SCIERAISSGDIMEHFYGKLGKVVAGLGSVMICTGWLASQVVALGIVFEVFLQLPATWGVWLGAGIVLFYSAVGGMRAIAATDVFQFAVLLIAIPLLCIVGLQKAGGISGIEAAVASSGKLSFLPHGEHALQQWSIFWIFLVPKLEPHALQRVLLARDTRQAGKAYITTGIFTAIFYLVSGTLGLVALALLPNIESAQALPRLIQEFVPIGVKGMFLAGLLAVIMSSADSVLHVASVSFAHDVALPLTSCWLTQGKRELRLAQIAALVLGLISISVALYLPDGLAIVLGAVQFWGPFVTVPLFAAVFGFRASSRTFLITTVCAALSLLMWHQILTPMTQIKGLVPTLLINTIVFFTARLFDPLHIRIEKKPDGSVVAHAGREQVSTLSGAAAQDHAYRQGLFTVYGILNFLIPAFLLSAQEHHGQNTLAFALFVIACFAAFPPLFTNDLPRFLQRIMPVYWRAALAYCLPFLSVFMLLQTKGSALWLCNTLISLYLLSVLTQWWEYLYLLVAGCLLGAGFAWGFTGTSALAEAAAAVPVWFWATSSGMAAACLTSAYYSQKIAKRRIDLVRVGFTQGVHDGLTPASDVRNRSETVKDYLPRLLESHKKAEAAGLDVKPLDQDEETMLRELPETLYDSAAGNLSHWTAVLYNTRDEPQKLEIELLSAAEVVHAALRVYPFKYKEEKKLVTVNVIKDGKFYGDKSLVNVVIFNFVNNSLHYVRKNPGSRIVITINVIGRFVVISVWDNAEGLTQIVLENMFESMFSTREGGSGCGLSSNVKNVAAHGGYIKGEGKKTKEEKYARFSTFFPCCEEGAPVPKGAPKPSVTYSNIRSEKLFEAREKAMIEEVLRAAERQKNNPQPPRETPEEKQKRMKAQMKALAERNKKLREEEEKQL